ncbi:MAG: DUF1553 domain-containing protein [Bryobacterales bacterium]|nr:DUF1553 domain-containing protein [Bryobacterales bacterium]
MKIAVGVVTGRRFFGMLLLAGALLAAPPVGILAASVDFGREVRPILSDRCFSCHGPDAAQRQAGLRLDLRDAALAPARSGKAPVSPGAPDASEVLRRVESADPAIRMPPAYMGHAPLEPAEAATLRRWIEDGAEYSIHWAFRPPERPAQPAVSDPGWPREPLDAFVLARLETEGLTPSPELSPAKWLRRMTLDITGLPPSRDEIAAFEASVSQHGEAAYHGAADRALASPRHGERMAMDWLDVARYADTHGFNNDSERSMWRWRDWVIAAFNQNLPYDRFIVEQLAGDLLPAPTLDQRIATGFNRNHVINSEGGIIDEEYRVEYVADRVRTVGMAWLGLTFECARCHDHKFDPISQEDYYRLFAFFDNVPEQGEAGRVANAVPMIPAPTLDQRGRIAGLRDRVRVLERGFRERAARWEPPGDLRADAVGPEYPENADFYVGCEDEVSEGIAGSACLAREVKPDAPVELEKHGAFTVAMWMRADGGPVDGPLFSAIDYSPDPASSRHGNGIELRAVGGEVELRMSTRYPSYSVTVRSDGAGLLPGRWRHVAAVYEGSEGRSSMRTRASWVRMFVDGRELGTRVIHDDLHSPAKFARPYRLGHDNHPESEPFEGWTDEVAVWAQALTPAQIRQAFEVAAIPWALLRAGTGPERSWLYRSLHPDAELESLRAELFGVQRDLPTTMVMEEMPERRQTRLLMRGRYDSPGDPVAPDVPENLLGAWPPDAPRDRLGLAQWLTQSRHPTTARVVVNRFWQQLFGIGLVKTSGDFGLQGEPPSHPGLMDWLAVEFADSGWDVKRLLKSIVLSSTYRQHSAAGPALREKDPENRLLARGPRFRLPAEAIRDQALAVSGLLAGRVGGPSVRPYQPEDLYTGVVVGADYPGTTWEQSEGEDLYRRGLYTFWKRTLPHPAMTVFDAPDREFCTVRRSTTNTPLQALTLMNDPTYVEAARTLAERVLRASVPGRAERISLLFELAAGRRPDTAELSILGESLSRLQVSFEGAEGEAGELLQVGASGFGADLDPKQLAAYAALASLILNLDEVITKG